MSLQLAAQHMASRGRGPDTMLVHMAPSEVNALQTVAKAHGGSLTVNPDTGLPEAGFLSSILPMIAGVGLTAVSGGALSPLMAGLLTGGVTGVATGNLGKGLMAGLGAYGGAGLGAGLAGAGAQEAILQANPGMAASEIARASVEPGFIQPSMTDKMLSGFKGLGSEAGRDAFMQSIGGVKGLFKSGYTAALPMMLAQSGETARPPSGGGNNPYEYDFNPGYTGPVATPGGGTRFFDPRFVLRRAAGGETYADGGDTGMTGQSDDYYRYLMGLAPAPRPYTPAPVAAPAATQADTAPLAVTNPIAARRDNNNSDSMAFDDYNNPQNPNAWGNLTPLQQATFYANNPGYSAVSKGVSNFFAGTALGKLQAALDPKGTLERSLVVQGLDPATGLPPGLNLSTVPVSIQEGMLSGLEGIGPNLVDVPSSVQEGMLSGLDGPTDAAGVAGSEAANVAEGMSSVAEGAVDSGPTSAGEYARGGLSSLAAFANGGYNLGDYSDGGRLLRGPGDGVSDSIPASIANKRPARLADGEFVVPARIVSELGNGSTEAGARRLYEMMDRIQKNRARTTGKGKVAVNSRSDKYLPA